jgi:hypothetical protein
VPASLARAVLVLLLACFAGDAAAQCAPDPCVDPVSRGPRTSGHVQTAAINAALGGLTAGILARARGKGFGAAFLRGAAGGALVYAGKRTAAASFDGAGFLGREIAAVGGSVSVNAAEGRGALDRLVLPVGPVRLYVTPGQETPVRARVDAAAVGTLLWVASRPHTSFDAGASLSAGGPVFRQRGTSEDIGWEGAQFAGVTVLRRSPPGFPLSAADDPARAEGTRAHEQVHVLQYDQAFLLWSLPAETAILDRSATGRALNRWVDLGLNAAVIAGANSLVSHDERPWEREAYFLSRSSPEEFQRSAALQP